MHTLSERPKLKYLTCMWISKLVLLPIWYNSVYRGYKKQTMNINTIQEFIDSQTLTTQNDILVALIENTISKRDNQIKALNNEITLIKQSTEQFKNKLKVWKH